MDRLWPAQRQSQPARPQDAPSGPVVEDECQRFKEEEFRKECVHKEIDRRR